MAELTLDVARTILDAALAKAGALKLKPLVIAILDARGALKLTAEFDDTIRFTPDALCSLET